MEENRAQAYLPLIHTLLNSLNGEGTQIWQATQNCWIGGFSKVALENLLDSEDDELSCLAC